jgi:putative lipoprotein
MQTMDNIVSGTVTYRQRIALPQTAILTVRLLDVSRQDASAPVIAEQRIETAGRQVPFSFELAYDRRLIQERNRYAVRAEIADGGRLLFTTDTNYPVITQGNPRSVEIVLASVGGGRGTGTGVGSALIRGTVTYRQRIALGPNSEITVKLVDSSNPAGTPVSETSFSSGNRQVPIPFELRYEPRDINRQRNYELRAEIRTDGDLRFRTEQGQPINLISGQPVNVELVLVAATEEPEAITGQNINLAKFGTGSLQIGNRGNEFIVRGGVVVRTDGTAEVTLNRIAGGIMFSGKLTYLDQNTLRITVTNSGNADASGEIEVRYSGRTLNSLAGNGLVLDGQDVVLRF